ncbi:MULTISPECIES: MmgE/PrpD family protein [Pseudoxanthomonas]|uniref:2-methylcitrate dehydratase PrpD n=1 Tax=Pseudoxanthomonas winnipegensis TaxID=2480810 RepID=A0AAW8GAZ3_9GAMM|nr:MULTISPECIES: MmgE/PrpD family protein [Pseudoxanthomonas]MDQ1119047.1 2-methylcitrate dehydratase PrpD [Pseudoxanthomonas winnipegensis]MDQ1132235.1 2-methylcitrate dehydratase PrpD [Pseudoxanthomonas winnipegensis]MDR6137750.1 2-methylcitrate dehydratase PrpD [Pseudoxanthomonas sp. SORGH_AS_0997]
MTVDRRTLVKSAGLALGAAVYGPAVAGQQAGAAERPALSSPPAVTRILAEWILASSYKSLPENVRREGVRSFLNWVGVAIGGSQHETVEVAVSALQPFSGPPQAGLFGRVERFDIMNAAFLNGVASHIFDFDDTHLKTVIHPAAPVASAILAYAAMKPVSGRDFLDALVVGIETECRIGNAVYPDHYDAGWHITGTCGPFGAAAAAGKLMGLSQQQMVYALGLAASQPVGLRESFGSMNKSFNPGRAAANGLFAAILAAKGFTSSEQMIEAKRGWANTISTKQDWSQIIDGLGTRYESLLNTYKPFACGIVMHPTIDAAIQIRDEDHVRPEDISRVDLKVHPLVLELTGKTAPKTGLEGKFSIYHAAAVALVEGAGGEKQFSDRAVNDPRVVALRQKVVPVVTPGIQAAQVDMTVTLNDGRRFHRFIEHAIGSVEKPMSDRQLEAKFADLAADVLPKSQADHVMRLCRSLPELKDAGDVLRAGARAS